MPARRRTDAADGRRALASWRADPAAASTSTVALAVRASLEDLAEVAPGHAVEVRVAPYGVVQVVAGPRHTRGTPPNVVEMDAPTWLGLVTGDLTWAQALASGRLRASGQRADLSAWLPLAATVGP